MTSNPFRHFWDLGYKSLVSISPVDCELDEKSSIALHARGKAPAEKQPDGKWKGRRNPGWGEYQATEADLDRWFKDGANVGLRMDDGLRGIDIDASVLETADAVEKRCIDMLGPSPLRVGRWPRRLLLYRLTEDTLCQTISFDGPPDKDGKPIREKIEITVPGKQAVIFGRHPTSESGKYEWPRRPVPASEITLITPKQFHAWRDAVRALLPMPQDSSDSTASDRAKINQATLVSNVETVRKIVQAIPNNRNIYPDREQYVDVGTALRSALRDDLHEAYELWIEWAAKDGGGKPEFWESDWQRICRVQPPFALGLPWLLKQAKTFGHYDQAAEEWHEPVPAAEPAPTEAIKWVRPSEWAGCKPKPREWEVEGFIPKGEVTLLYGDGGIGKTLLMHQYATAAATGVPWLGQPTRQARVMCFFCEDSEDELHRRQIDINKSLGVSFEDTDERLRITSRKHDDNMMALWGHDGVMKRQPIWERLGKDAVEFGANVLILDTIADIFGGNEVKKEHVTPFVKAVLGRLAAMINGTVIGLAHPSMSGKASGTGTSGNVAWNNSVRSRLYLRYPKGSAEKGNLREIEGMKSNYGAKGNVIKLRWNRGAFDVIAATVAPASHTDSETTGPIDGFQSVEAACDAATLDALCACAGTALSMKPGSTNFAPKVLKRREADLLAGYSAEEVEGAIQRLEARKAIIAGEVGRNANRHSILGFTVVSTASPETSTSDDSGVFD